VVAVLGGVAVPVVLAVACQEWVVCPAWAANRVAEPVVLVALPAVATGWSADWQAQTQCLTYQSAGWNFPTLTWPGLHTFRGFSYGWNRQSTIFWKLAD
jgi:hypothetical protein